MLKSTHLPLLCCRHCFQRSVQLSRLNFDLDDETAQVQKPSGIQKDDNENSSSDEEELWPDKSPQQPSQVMEVDVVNRKLIFVTLQLRLKYLFLHSMASSSITGTSIRSVVRQ